MKKVLNLLVLLVGGVVIINLILGCVRLWRAGGRVEEAAGKVEELRRNKEELKKRLEYVRSGEFIEKEAREKLGMAKADEVVVILPKLEERQGEKKEEEAPNWKKWQRLFF